MGHESLKDFAAALDRAGWEILATRGVNPAERYRLLVEVCPVHGYGCARVTYGMFRDHAEWARTDATGLAAALLGTMLPPVSAAGPSHRREAGPGTAHRAARLPRAEDSDGGNLR